jgi:hypothetical protein
MRVGDRVAERPAEPVGECRDFRCAVHRVAGFVHCGHDVVAAEQPGELGELGD